MFAVANLILNSDTIRHGYKYYLVRVRVHMLCTLIAHNPLTAELTSGVCPSWPSSFISFSTRCSHPSFSWTRLLLSSKRCCRCCCWDWREATLRSYLQVAYHTRQISANVLCRSIEILQLKWHMKSAGQQRQAIHWSLYIKKVYSQIIVCSFCKYLMHFYNQTHMWWEICRSKIKTKKTHIALNCKFELIDKINLSSTSTAYSF